MKREAPRYTTAEVDEELVIRRVRRTLRIHSEPGISPLNIKDMRILNYDDSKQSSWVKPIYSSIVYRTQVTTL